jgi:hypothetical protein
MPDTQPLLAPAPELGSTVPRLVSSITACVEHTVARWSEEILDPRAVDWSAVLLGALQHRVEGLCADALRLAGWQDAAPVSVVGLLDRRRLAAEASFQAHYLALRELRALDEELVSGLVVLNGAALVGRYATTSHRMLGDVDLLVAPDAADRLAARLRELGYWEKAGARGPSFFREAPDPVVLDVNHNSRPVRAEPYAWGDVPLRRLPGAVELVRQVVRLQRHAASWVHWTLEDDVRLIHLLDIEVLAAALDDGPGAVLEQARATDTVAALALGLAVVKAVRGTVPTALEALEPLADAVAPCTRLLALPTGHVLDVGEPLAVRALALDKSARACALVGTRGPWCTWRRGVTGDGRGLAEVERRAHARLAAAGLPA